LIHSGPVHADSEYRKCVDAGGATNAAWSECGGEWMKRADAELNATWKDLRLVVAGDTAQALLDEQRAWNAYKEKSCMFWASGEYGREGQVINYPACRAEVIEERTARLKHYLERVQPR
jgi:uncharacterized protein YecT (DUF1311 family)